MTTARPATPGTMRDARLVETEVLLSKPKRFVREGLVMPDGFELDWYYVDTPPSVMVVPVTGDGDLVLVRQYRHNLKSYALEFPAGTASEGEDLAPAALRELEEETGFTLRSGAELRPLGAYYSLPSETNKYTHLFVAEPVIPDGPANGDTEIEKYFDMSIVVMPFSDALAAIGKSIRGTETITALMLANCSRLALQLQIGDSVVVRRQGRGGGAGAGLEARARLRRRWQSRATAWWQRRQRDQVSARRARSVCAS